MTDHEKNKPDHSLDEVLALMAEEVPPMPADFHEKWTKAVREEAAKSETKPEKENSRVTLINRWTRILSVAAVFVFLIGGTLVYRSSRPKTTTLLSAEKDNKAAAQITDEPVAEAAGAFHAMKAAEEENVIAAEEPAAADNMAAMEADAVMEEAAEADSPMMSLSASGTSNKQEAAATDAETEETADAAMAMDAGEVRKTQEEAPAQAVHMTPDPTQNPEEAAESEPAKAETETKGQPGLLQSIGGFFKDMGAFLLIVWPYLLILAVPAAAALLYSRKKRQH